MAGVETYPLDEAARRVGVSADELRHLCDLGILTPEEDGRFTPAHLRRASLVKSLADAGIQMDGLATAIARGQVSLDFIDAQAFDRFSALSGDTFAEVAERTGVPVEHLLFIREANGSVAAAPNDRIRDEELVVADLVATAITGGIRSSAVEQVIRVHGDAMRRLAETEAAFWNAEVVQPAMEAGKRADEVFGADFGDRMSLASERALVATYHLQQLKAWTANLIEGLELDLAAAGLHTRADHPPAMCFLDITGYTRLTQQFGDEAAARLAERLGRIVGRTAARHGGRAVKWLGDGVMLHFPDPARGVVAALDMAEVVVDSGLPPAHVGLHSGPVIFQEADYYGSTVNIAARIAAHASPGQVVVSQDVVEASADAAGVSFEDIGPVELKGVVGAVRLFEATRDPRPPLR